MSKRILSIILSVALLLGAAGVTGILSVSAADELTVNGKVIATYKPVTKAADLPTDTQLNRGKVAFRYDRAAGYNLKSGGNPQLIKSMKEDDQNDLPNENRSSSALEWSGLLRSAVIRMMSDGVYLTGYAETAEAEANGTANIPIPWKSGTYWETDDDGNTISDRNQTTYAGWPSVDDSQYMVYDLGAVSQVTKIGIGSGVERPAFNAASAPKTEAELQALMGQTKNAGQALTKVSVYVGNDLANLFGSPTKDSNGKTTLSGDTYRVLTYDFSADKEKALANIFTLASEATGRYVGFYFHYNGIPYINELAVYGEQRTTSLNTTNADVLTQLGANRLATAERLTGSLADGSGAWGCLTDGVIYGVTTTDETNKNAKCGIVVGGDKKNPITGEEIPNITGWGSLTFRLSEETMLTHVLMAGSAADEEKNRYVRFYEFYASDAQENLFQEKNRILCYDNTTSPQLALLHKLATSVTCTYVGVRFTGDQYNQARISELAVYGTTAATKSLGDSYGTQYQPITEAADIPQRDSLIAGKQPLNGNHLGNEGTATAVTDGAFMGVNTFVSYQTTTENTGDPVPGEEGLYFAYNKYGYSVTNCNLYRAVYLTEASKGGLLLDELYPLTFDLGASCTVDAVAIGSSVEPGAWKKGSAPKTEAAYTQKKNDRDMLSLLLKGEVYIGDSVDTLYSEENRVMNYDWSNGSDRSKATNNYFILGEAKTGRYVGFKFNPREKFIRVGELAVYGTSASEGEDLGDSYGTKYQPIKKAADIPQRDSLIAGKQPLNGNHLGNEGTATAVTDGAFMGVNTFVSYQTTTENTGDPVPGEEGLYFAYKNGYSVTNCNLYRSVYLTEAGKEGLYLDKLYPLTFDLGASCTVDALAIGSSVEPGAWKKGEAPKTEAAYAQKKNDRDLLSFLLKGEVYIGDSLDTLYSEENRVMNYDWSNGSDRSKAANNYFILGEAKTGRYVGFKFNPYWNLLRVGELAVYGTKPEDPSGVIQLTVSNVNELKKLGDNRLFGAETLTGMLASGSGGWSCLSDGEIYGITTKADAYKNSKCGIVVGTDKTNPITGEEIPGISGWGSASFQLMGDATLTHVLMAGSGGDEGNNRFVRFYEFYASMSAADLFRKENRIVCYDNTQDPQLAQLHTLETAVTCRYVGVRFTGEQYTQARISEIGLYGDMDIPETLPFKQINSQTEYETALANQGANLLKGERVGNKVKNYLLGNDLSISKGDEAWLTDDYINWTNTDTEQKVEVNAGSNDKFYYDLRGRVSLKSVLVASSGKDSAAYRPDRIAVYMSDDEDTLFEESSLVGQALTGGYSVAVLIDLSAKNASGRYIGFSIPGDSQYKVLRLTEMGVYGTYLTEPTPIPINLLAKGGAKRVDHFQVDARGIDNKTAVGANGAAGKNNNTGAMPSKRAVSSFDNLDNLTDGDFSTRSVSSVSTNPEAVDKQVLNYDNSWLGFTYYLGGASKLDVVSLVSSNEWGYYVTGVQIYASYYYKDLFKNEALLYTSGGEHYTGSEAEGYLPDLNYEVYKREIKYALTEEQRAQEYRYIAFVVTRAFPLYWPGSQKFCVGYGMARIGELTAYGEITTPEPPLNNTWEVDTRFGKATVTIEPDNYDDREFYLQIHHATIDEEPIPASVQRNVNNNWLTVVGDTLFHLRFWDANGKQVNDTSNKRDVMVVLQIDHQYNYTAGIIRDGQIQRLYNAFVRPDNTLRLGEVNYPFYAETMKNNRDKATFQEMDASLVLLQWNDPRTVDALDGNVHYGSVTEFFGTAVAGAATQTGNRALSPWWLLVPVALTAVGLTGVYWLRRRKHGAAEQ